MAGPSTLDFAEVRWSHLYGQYSKPRLVELLSLLKLDVSFVRASGECLYRVVDGRELPVYDMLGGYGSTILGHNHSDIVAEARRALDGQLPVHAQLSVRPYAALLAEHLSLLLDDRASGSQKPRYIVHLLNTGTEAVEGALKHALMQWRDRQAEIELLGKRTIARTPDLAPKIEPLQQKVAGAEPVVLAFQGSFHGKTAGSVAVTHNYAYRDMYPIGPVRTTFLPRDSTPADAVAAFEKPSISLIGGVTFSPIVAVILELVQGEGGAHVLDPALVRAVADECRRRRVPLIIDEIQSGLYRTGSLLAAHAYGVDADYITLGKALGGGLAKISALLIRREIYKPEFSVLHTSTFAEDDFSSRIALRTLDLLIANGPYIAHRAALFEGRIRAGMREIMGRYPGVIGEVRGRGFLLGLQFDPALGKNAPVVLEAMTRTGLLAYLSASYLLHHYGVRVAPALSDNATLRLEPCAFVGEEAVTRLLSGIESLCAALKSRRFFDIAGHIWTPSVKSVVWRSPPPVLTPASDQRLVTFMSHLVDAENAALLDPFIAALSVPDRERLFTAVWPLTASKVYWQQEIRGANGTSVLLNLRGLFALSHSFEACLRAGDRTATDKVHEAVRAALEDGSSHVGLGQFTSVVTDSGGLLIDLVGRANARITTGNSLTVGFGLRALQRAVEQRGLRLSDMRVAVIGVAGNICSVYAQLLADEAAALTVVHREAYDSSSRFRAAVDAIVQNSRMPREKIRPTSSFDDLADCDCVVLGTNSTGQLLFPRHLKRGAIVLDISVPSNVHPSVLDERPDVACFQGGFARLPLGQRLGSSLVPAPDGQVFACMAETLMLGLLDYPGCYSFGPLSKEKVLQALEMAKTVGIELGSLRPMMSLPIRLSLVAAGHTDSAPARA